MFNIAIDSLMDVIPRDVSAAIYADDCTIWTQGRTIPLVFQKIQRALTRIGEWAVLNGFLFSSAKSNAILFRRGLKRVDPRQYPTLKLDGQPTALVDQVRYLGVILDSELNLNSHVEYVNPRLTGGGRLTPPPSRIFAIAQKRTALST